MQSYTIFFLVPAIVQAAMEALSRLVIYLFILRGLALVLKMCKHLILRLHHRLFFGECIEK